jgi:hypothetical protein
MIEHIPLPIAIALIATTAGCIYFFVTAWISAKERDQSELDSRFDAVYRHIDLVESNMDRRISDDTAALWRAADDIGSRLSKFKTE